MSTDATVPARPDPPSPAALQATLDAAEMGGAPPEHVAYLRALVDRVEIRRATGIGGPIVVAYRATGMERVRLDVERPAPPTIRGRIGTFTVGGATIPVGSFEFASDAWDQIEGDPGRFLGGMTGSITGTVEWHRDPMSSHTPIRVEPAPDDSPDPTPAGPMIPAGRGLADWFREPTTVPNFRGMGGQVRESGRRPPRGRR